MHAQLGLERALDDRPSQLLQQAVAQRSPWILAGFSPELEKTWKQNRAAVVDAVEQRRRQVLSQAQGVAA